MIYVFRLNVPEIALPLIVVKMLHASPAWAAGIFVTNTALVVAFQVLVTVWLARCRAASRWPQQEASSQCPTSASCSPRRSGAG